MISPLLPITLSASLEVCALDCAADWNISLAHQQSCCLVILMAVTALNLPVSRRVYILLLLLFLAVLLFYHLLLITNRILGQSFSQSSTFQGIDIELKLLLWFFWLATRLVFCLLNNFHLQSSDSFALGFLRLEDFPHVLHQSLRGWLRSSRRSLFACIPLWVQSSSTRESVSLLISFSLLHERFFFIRRTRLRSGIGMTGLLHT